METRDLEYLLAVEQEGSIGRAAERLKITQPALTKAIRRLERQAGLALFERTPKGMVPSQAGAAFIARAHKIQIEFDDALRELEDIRTGSLGLLRLGFSPTVPKSLVLGATRQLLRERPAVQLRMRELLTRELIDALAAGTLDVLLARIPEFDIPGIVVQPLFEDRLFVVADATHPLQRLPVLGLSQLVGQEWLLPGTHILLRQEIDAAFRARGLPLPVVRAEADFGNMAMFGLVPGTRLLSVCGAESLARLEGLRALNIASDELQLDRQIGILHRKSAYLSPLTRRFLELVHEHARQQVSRSAS